MKQLLLFIVTLFCFSTSNAQSDIYVCTDSKGVKTYGNVGGNKGCKKVDLPGITMIPAPKTKRAGKTSAASVTTPNDFPKVDDSTQKKRDMDRKQILDAELKAEQKKLANLKAEYKNGEPDRLGNERNFAKYQERTENLKQDINRSQQNVDAIQREIGGLN